MATNFGNTTPVWWRNTSRALHTFIYTLIGLVSTTSIFDPHTKDVMLFALPVIGGFIIFVSMAMGQKPEDVIEQQANKINKRNNQ